MAEIRAFKGMRFTKEAGDISVLVCPPYDIISEEQRVEFLKTNLHNIIRLELPRGEDPYKEAKETLDDWLDNGLLKSDMDAGLYIYELEFLSKVDKGEKKSLKGLICRVRIEDFENNVVLPHEETLSKAKKDRFELTKATNCNFSQIYSLYPDEEHVTRQRMDNITKSAKPRYDFDDGLVRHRLWVINDRLTIKAIRDDFKDRKLYIADGHHRYETSINYRNYMREKGVYDPDNEYVMMYLADMADDGLVVFPTHRMVRGLENFDSKNLLEKCSEYFETEEIEGDIEDRLEEKAAEGKIAFVYYDGSGRYLLTLKSKDIMAQIIPDMSDDYRMLDVSVLHSLILERIFKIDKENMANQKNLTYTRSVEEAMGSVDNGESNCAFFLNPTAVSEIGAVAQNGEKMPQKSTYFYPKLLTGLVMNNMGDK